MEEEEPQEEEEQLDVLGEVDALFEAMEQAKEAVGDDDPVLFRTKPLMGRWTLHHIGVACDAYQSCGC